MNSYDQENLFHQNSFIYQFTNEDIYSYQSYLENKKKIFSITASGDQILSSILLGTKEIDSFDISRFPRYYMELKKAAILSLSREEFLRFFSPKDSWFRLEGFDCNEMYYSFHQNMPKNDQFFWDEILKDASFFDIYDSLLFQSVVKDVSILFENIPYLEQKNYDHLKQKLKDVEINHMVGDIFSVADLLNEEYDLVNLSNLIDHATLNSYQNLVEKLKLTKEGCILSYMFGAKSQDRELNVTWDLHKVKRNKYITHQRKNMH